MADNSDKRVHNQSHHPFKEWGSQARPGRRKTRRHRNRFFFRLIRRQFFGALRKAKTSQLWVTILKSFHGWDSYHNALQWGLKVLQLAKYSATLWKASNSCWVIAVIHMRVAKEFSWPLSFLCPIVQCCPQTVPTPYCWWGQWPLMAGSPPKPLWNIPCLVWEAPTLPLSAPSNPHQVLHHPSWRNQCPHELILWEGFKTPVRNNSVMWGLLIFSR